MIFFKKIILFCFAVLFCVGLTQAQCPQGNITFETQANINNFAALYPTCTEIADVLQIGTNSDSDITDLSPLNQITFIGGIGIFNNPNLVSLSGLENVILIEGHLNISDNDNLLNLNALENLSSIGSYLSIEDNTNLNSLTGLNNLSSIGGQLRVSENDNLVDFSGLDNLISVAGDFWIDDNDSLINFNGLENLISIEGVILIQDNMTLNSLSGLQNFDYSTIITLDIIGNQMLSVCNFPSICSHIENGGSTAIFDNAPGCNNSIEISDACDFIPKIQVAAFYDINQNKIQESNEPNYYDISILITPGDNSYYTQNDGIFYIAPGSYTVTFDEANNSNWQLTTDSTNYFLSLAEGEIATITFGIYPTQQVSHIQTTINSPNTRCNEVITMNVTTKNLGTTIASGIMWLTIDDAIPAFNFIHEPDTVIADFDTYGWYYTDLYPGQSIIKNVAITVPGPPDFDLGERLLFGAFSQYTDANGDDTSEGFRYDPEVRCSYDPNDKLVNPKREGDYVLFEEDFIYTIRFQNTGNDVAYDVVIRDTLDANLDLTTFRVLGSSHADLLNTILNEDERILTFEFRDIFLPDSTSNFDASQGYVNYLISPFDGLAEETPITNSAGIYFDLNPPVITNTVQSIMVSELPTVSTETPDHSYDFNILPNPNSGVFTVQGISTGTYQIHNTSGQIIREGKMQNDPSIDISHQAQGVYFISIQIENEVISKRLIKM